MGIDPIQVRVVHGAKGRSGSTEPFHGRGPGKKPRLDFGLFRHLESAVNLDPKVPDSALQLRVPKEKLHGAQIPRASVDQSRLRSA